MPLVLNTPAPNFTLQDQDGNAHTLSDYQGSWVLLYFYPKDNTPGCTTEACAFRDQWSDFTAHGITVFGLSPDSTGSHAKFKDTFSLPFTLLSDPDKKVLTQYEAWGEKSMFGKKYMGVLRSSVLINPQGLIAKLYPKVNVKNHAQEVLDDILALKS